MKRGCCWDSHPRKKGTSLFRLVTTVIVVAIATQRARARASTAVVLYWFLINISTAAQWAKSVDNIEVASHQDRGPHFGNILQRGGHLGKMATPLQDIPKMSFFNQGCLLSHYRNLSFDETNRISIEVSWFPMDQMTISQHCFRWWFVGCKPVVIQFNDAYASPGNCCYLLPLSHQLKLPSSVVPSCV